MPYNLTGAANVTSIVGVIDIVNTASNGFFGLTALIAVFLVLLFRLLSNNPVPESFFSASTATEIVCIIFLLLDWATIPVLVGFSIIWAGSAIALYKSNSV